MKLLLISVVQSSLLCAGQVLLKFALQALGTPSWSMAFVLRSLANWWLLACGLCYGAATLLWLYIIKHYPFSMAYPMISLSYVFGMLAAVFIFHEQVPLARWGGVLLIIAGCALIAK